MERTWVRCPPRSHKLLQHKHCGPAQSAIFSNLVNLVSLFGSLFGKIQFRKDVNNKIHSRHIGRVDPSYSRHILLQVFQVKAG